MKRDWRTAPVDPRTRATLRFLEKVTLHPSELGRADAEAVRAGAVAEIRGARAVAGTLVGRARAARPALVNGTPGAVWAPGGRPRIVLSFTIVHGKVAEIAVLADPERLRHLDVVILDD